MCKEEFLGMVDYFGRTAHAIRRIMADGSWQFVLCFNDEQMIMMTF